MAQGSDMFFVPWEKVGCAFFWSRCLGTENTDFGSFWRSDKMPFNQIMLYLQKELLKYKQEARNLQGIKVRKGALHQLLIVKL